jgi:hypothetical protein
VTASRQKKVRIVQAKVEEGSLPKDETGSLPVRGVEPEVSYENTTIVEEHAAVANASVHDGSSETKSAAVV